MVHFRSVAFTCNLLRDWVTNLVYFGRPRVSQRSSSCICLNTWMIITVVFVGTGWRLWDLGEVRVQCFRGPRFQLFVGFSRLGWDCYGIQLIVYCFPDQENLIALLK